MSKNCPTCGRTTPKKRGTIIAFELSMPNVGSWNGKWSGAGRCYAIVKSYTSIKAKEKAQTILAKRSYYYRWSDGWGASVGVREVDSQEARKLRKASQGFCGYDWMVDSIEKHGKIYASHDEIPAKEAVS